MRYMFLIYGDPSNLPSESLREDETKRYFAFTQDALDQNVMQAGDPLEPADVATTVRVRDGKVLTTDGPFAETKEVLGGYYILDLPNLDEALAWAAKIPGARYGSVEVRPIRVIPGM